MKHLKKLILVAGLLIFIKGSSFSQALNAEDDSCKMIPEYIPFRSGNKFGYCDRNKKILIKPIFDQAEPFMAISYSEEIKTSSNQFATVKKGKGFFRIDKTGKIVERVKYEKFEETSINYDPSNMQQTFLILKSDGLYGLKNLKTDETILPVEYQEIFPFDPSLYLYLPFIVKKDNKFGLVLSNGQIVVPAKYDSIHDTTLTYYFKKIRLVLVELNEELFFIDYCGNEYR